MKGAKNPDPNGEEVQINDYLDARNISEEEVIRRVEMSSGEVMMIAYRDDDQHVILIKTEDGEIKEERAPAERQRVVPGQKLWTIPDNWLGIYKHDEYAIFRPQWDDLEYFIRVETSSDRPKDVGEIQYIISEVGVDSPELTTEVGSQSEMETTLNWYEEWAEEQFDYIYDDEVRSHVFGQFREHWDVITQSIHNELEIISNGWLPLSPDDESSPGPFGGAHQLDSEGNYQLDDYTDGSPFDLFQVGAEFNKRFDSGDLGDAPGLMIPRVCQYLQHRSILPRTNMVKITLDESKLDMDYYIRALVEGGCSPAEALDYYYVEIDGITQTEQAERRGVGQDTVSRNVAAAKGEIGHPDITTAI